MDFKKSGCNGNQGLRQRRGTFVPGGKHLYAYGMAALRVFWKLSGALIIFRDVVGDKTRKASQGHISEGPENYLDEFSLGSH